MPAPLLRQSKGKPHHPVNAAPGEDRLLGDGLFRFAMIDAPTDLGVLALGVFAHDDKIDVVGSAAGQW